MASALSYPILSLLIWHAPVGVACIQLSRKNHRLVQFWAWLTMIVGLVFGGIAYAHFDPSLSDMQFVERLPWLPNFNSDYALGADGLSITLVLLNLYITAIVVLYGCSRQKKHLVDYLTMFFLMEAFINGVFLATDALLYYVFWEAMLIPMYLCIGIWGSQDRSFAAMKFFLFTFVGSVLMLLAFIYMGALAQTFDIASFYKLTLSSTEQYWIFLAMFLAFAVKIPMCPIHSWLPAAHTEAPAGGSVILAAMMLKVGAYGLLRFNMPIAPQAAAYFAPYIIALSLLAVVFIGLVALVQEDMKRLIAYSSIAHMGFVTLGCFIIY